MSTQKYTLKKLPLQDQIIRDMVQYLDDTGEQDQHISYLQKSINGKNGGRGWAIPFEMQAKNPGKEYYLKNMNIDSYQILAQEILKDTNNEFGMRGGKSKSRKRRQTRRRRQKKSRRNGKR
jgi:hypothetical protein